MRMRISYWTYWLDSLMVAVSKEVFELMRHFPNSYAFGVSSKYFLKMSFTQRMFGVNLCFYPLFRYAIPLIEQQFDISHVHTNLSDWHFLNGLGRRPIVLTLTSKGDGANIRLLSKVSHIVAQSEQLAQSAIQSGFSREKVSLIYPGVNLRLFTESPPPPTQGKPWKCLFASSPENSQEIHTKGVDLLLELAASEPDIEITILWRPFGRDSDHALRKVQEYRLPNVIIHQERLQDINRFYGQYHFTVAPFRTVGKPCPNSILESLASGRPVLVSRYVDIAGLIEQENVGVVFEQTLCGLREAFHELCEQYQSLQKNTRICAEKYFDMAKTIASYKTIYEKIMYDY